MNTTKLFVLVPVEIDVVDNNGILSVVNTTVPSIDDAKKAFSMHMAFQSKDDCFDGLSVFVGLYND